MSENENNGANLTPRARKALIQAQNEAERLHSDCVSTEHLLLGLLALNEGVALEVLKHLQISLEQLRFEVEKNAIHTSGDVQKEGKLPLTARMKRIILLAATEAKIMNYNFIGTEHLLLALLRDGESEAARILRNMNVDLSKVRDIVLTSLDPDYLPGNQKNDLPNNAYNVNNESGELPALSSFGRNLTEMAEKNLLFLKTKN